MATPKAKDVLALASQIVELETQLAQLKGKWESLFSGSSMQPAKAAAEGASRSMAMDGLPGRILVAVRRLGGILTISQVATSIGEPELATGKVLYRLAKMNKIANPSRGKYAPLDRDIATEEEERIQAEELEALKHQEPSVDDSW